MSVHNLTEELTTMTRLGLEHLAAADDQVVFDVSSVATTEETEDGDAYLVQSVQIYLHLAAPELGMVNGVEVSFTIPTDMMRETRARYPATLAHVWQELRFRRMMYAIEADLEGVRNEIEG